MRKKREEKKNDWLKPTNMDKYIAGIDPIDNGKPPVVAIVGAGASGKTQGLVNKLVMPHLLNEWNEVPVMEFPKEMSEDFGENVKKAMEYYNQTGMMIMDSKPSYYSIVKDEAELNKFIEFLPDLKPEQKFYYCLFARKKYRATEGLKSDKCQLKRGTTTKERMLRDFQKLEVRAGLYEIDGIPIQQDSLVLYISPNPTDMTKSALKTAKQIVSDVAEGKRLKSPQATALSEIQVNVVRKYFNIDIDFTIEGFKYDKVGIENMIRAMECVNEEAINFVYTKGGFHILVEYKKIDKEFEKSWYRNFSTLRSDLFQVDMENGKGLLPVPGCVQSTYVPHLK